MVRSFNKILKTIKYCKGINYLLLAGTLLMCIDVILDIFIAWVQGFFMEIIIKGNIQQLKNMVIFGLIGVVIFPLINYIGDYIRSIYMEKSTRRLSEEVFNRLNSLPFSFFLKYSIQDIVARATYDIGIVLSTISNGVFGIFNNVIMIIAAFIFLAKINLQMSIIVVLTGPITFAFGRLADTKIRRLSNKLHDKSSEIRALVQEMVCGINEVKIYDLKSLFTNKFTTLKDEENKIIKSLAFFKGFMSQGIMVINASMMIVVIYYISKSSINGFLSVGTILSFVYLMKKVQDPFVGLSDTWGGIQQGLGVYKRVFEILDEPQIENIEENRGNQKLIRDMRSLKSNVDSGKRYNINDYKSTDQKTEMERYIVNIENLKFCFEEGTCLFDNLNLKIKHKQKVALVGTSGCGKTTLARIILKLYKAQSGKIEINHINSSSGLFNNDFNLDWSFKNDASYVSQNTYLFPGTIKENILFEDIEKINEMNKMTDTCLKFVKDLENGFETIIGDQALNLSGGQKQRIGIARAIVRDACVLVMDEPTAFLDKENEEIIIELIEEHTKEKALLLITHNLRVASKLDHIVVMDNGRIVEQGDHESLIKKGGLYCKLYSQNTTS